MIERPAFLLWMAVVALAVATAATAQEPEVWGTRAGEVMIGVSANFSEEDETWLWHLPMQSVETHSEEALRVQLSGGPLLYLPVKTGESAAATKELIAGAAGSLIRLEFHPTVDAPRGRVHASWTLSPLREIVGQGRVPVTNALYSSMLRQVGDEFPNTGIFAPLSSTQKLLELLIRNVTDGNGREADELAEDFLLAVDDAGLPLQFYRMADGSRASAAAIEDIRNTGYRLSAVDYWYSALSKFRQNRIVNPTLNEFEEAWSKVAPGTNVEVEFPGSRGGMRVLSDELLVDFRRICGQKYLAAAVSAANAEDPEWTGEMLRRFREEHSTSGLPLSEFRVDGRPATEGDFEGLVKRARREQGFAGWFRAIWHKILAAAVPGAPPV